MKNFLRLIFILIVIGASPLSSIAAEDIYQFSTAEQQQRFTSLTTQLRCLVCQNQNIAQSNSSLANDLRDQIYQKIVHGQSDQDIIQYLTTRYGSYVLYRPPFDYATLGLWLGPFVILLSGVSYLLFYLRKKSREHIR